MMTGHPSFIPDGLEAEGGDFVWRGTSDHIGPLDTETPLMRQFHGLTSCGCFCMAAGLMQWGAVRFSQLIDTSSLLQVSEAAFAFMSDPTAISLDQLYGEGVPEKPKVVSAFRKVRRNAMVCIEPGRWYENALPPTRELFHLAFLVRHLTGKTFAPAFDAWILRSTDRIRQVAPRPPKGVTSISDDPTAEDIRRYVAPYWGTPLPMALLSHDLAAAATGASYLAEMQGIDWSANRCIVRQPRFDLPYGRQ